jgi:transposase
VDDPGGVGELDLTGIYRAYRPDGHGRPAYEPRMMVALLLYSYSKGIQSSREIERKCREGVAFMVIAARRVPDHSTIAEFRRRHGGSWGICSRVCWGCAGRRGWCGWGCWRWTV